MASEGARRRTCQALKKMRAVASGRNALPLLARLGPPAPRSRHPLMAELGDP